MDMLTPGNRTLIRLAPAVLLWVLRSSRVDAGGAGGPILTLILDGALVVVHWWANRPLEAADPGRFARQDSPTKFLLLPMLVAVFLLLVDVKRLFS
jgi:hypothetical protein